MLFKRRRRIHMGTGECLVASGKVNGLSLIAFLESNTPDEIGKGAPEMARDIERHGVHITFEDDAAIQRLIDRLKEMQS